MRQGKRGGGRDQWRPFLSNAPVPFPVPPRRRGSVTFPVPPRRRGSRVAGRAAIVRCRNRKLWQATLGPRLRGGTEGEMRIAISC